MGQSMCGQICALYYSIHDDQWMYTLHNFIKRGCECMNDSMNRDKKERGAEKVGE